MNLKEKSEFRCNSCKKLLAVADDVYYEVKCHRCGSLNYIFNQIEEQVVITDIEGKILFANELVEKITGYSMSEIIGKRPSLWGGQMPKEFYQHLWKTIKDEKKSISVVVNNKRKDGVMYKAELHISPIVDTSGQILFFVGIEKIVD